MLIRAVYMVISPESMGNRMMVRAIESSKDFGDGGHDYSRPESFVYKPRWIEEEEKRDINILKDEIAHAPDEFVYVSSIPHGNPGTKKYLQIANIIQIMKDANYKVYPLILHRDMKYAIKSHVKNGHTKTENKARSIITKAFEHIFSELATVQTHPIIIKYEVFVTNKEYRNWIFRELGLQEPNMEFFNANENYK